LTHSGDSFSANGTRSTGYSCMTNLQRNSDPTDILGCSGPDEYRLSRCLWASGAGL
jgi:hypothetical protein